VNNEQIKPFVGHGGTDHFTSAENVSFYLHPADAGTHFAQSGHNIGGSWAYRCPPVAGRRNTVNTPK
jgi:hypothetical protein